MTPPPWTLPRTAYLHVPFCGHRCGYCDFAVTAGRDELIPAYVEALVAEFTRPGPASEVESLFLGGGTPTYLPPDELRKLLSAVNRAFPNAVGNEFSIESTPESLDRDKIRLLADHGVTRLSIGVQTFHPHLLRQLDRRHGVEQIESALGAARGTIPHLSLDLIYAVPTQTEAEWHADLSTATALGTAHLSCYGLTYEKGTPLWKARERGQVDAAAEETELAFYRAARDRLAAAGYCHYEISNFAKPGCESRHNHRYWANEAYHGYGVGAARYVNHERAMNRRDTRGYIKAVFAGDDPTQARETLTDRERAYETLATQLRRVTGIDRARFQEQTGLSLHDLTVERLPALIDLGLVTATESAVALTERGQEVADAVVSDLLKAC